MWADVISPKHHLTSMFPFKTKIETCLAKALSSDDSASSQHHQHLHLGTHDIEEPGQVGEVVRVHEDLRRISNGFQKEKRGR